MLRLLLPVTSKRPAAPVPTLPPVAVRFAVPVTRGLSPA